MRARRTIPTESQEQAVLIEWWGHYARSKGIDERLLMSIPNGAVLAGDSRRRAIQMNNLKRAGLRVGAPDLFLAYPTKLSHGMFLEMKRKGEKGTPDQIDFGMMLRSMGYDSLICLGADEAMKAIKGHIET